MTMRSKKLCISNAKKSDPYLSLFIFSLLLSFPSAAVLQKLIGIAGVVIFPAVSFLVLLIGRRSIFSKLSVKTEGRAYFLVAITLLILIIIFIVAYPIANSGAFGVGSDRDEALNIATTDLLNGRYPYYQKTYHNNPITPMPGSLFLAVPFVLAGNSAYQNFFWLLA